MTKPEVRRPKWKDSRKAGKPEGNGGRRGFSLIEIMVAVTLLAVITVGLLSMFYHTQKAFRLGAGQVDVLEGGRSTMQLLSRDLQEMYPSHVPEVVNFLAGGNARLDMDLGGGISRTNLLQDVSFLARRGDQWIGVAYRVDHQGLGAGTLYRRVMSTNAGFQSATPPLPEWQVVSNLFEDITLPAVPNLSSDANFHRVADGVVHLRARGAYDNRGRLYPETVWGVYAFTNEVPAYLDVELALLDPKGVTQFEARRSATPTARDYLVRQAHRVHVFTQRIPVRANRSEFDLLVVK